MIKFLQERKARKEVEKKQQEALHRAEAIKKAKADTGQSLEILRSIKTQPPRESKYYGRHEFRYNTLIYNVNKESIRRKLRETGTTFEDIGLSEEELGKIWMAAVKADLIVDAEEFGLIVTERSEAMAK